MASDQLARDRAIDRAERHLDTGIVAYSRVLRVTFPAANTRRDLAHGLGVTPDGYDLLMADAAVHATPGVLWTPTIAYLQATAAPAHALLRFFVLREDPIDA